MVKTSVGIGLFAIGLVLIWAGISGRMGVVVAALVSPTQLVPAGEGCP